MEDPPPKPGTHCAQWESLPIALIVFSLFSYLAPEGARRQLVGFSGIMLRLIAISIQVRH